MLNLRSTFLNSASDNFESKNKARFHSFNIYNQNYVSNANNRPKSDSNKKSSQDYESVNAKYDKYYFVHTRFHINKYGYGHYINDVMDLEYLKPQYDEYWGKDTDFQAKIYKFFGRNPESFAIYHLLGALFWGFVGFYLMHEGYYFFRDYFLYDAIYFFRNVMYVEMFVPEEYDYFVGQLFHLFFWVEYLLSFFFIFLFFCLMYDFYAIKNNIDIITYPAGSNYFNDPIAYSRFKCFKYYYWALIVFIIAILLGLNYFFWVRYEIHFYPRPPYFYPLIWISDSGDFYISMTNMLVKYVMLCTFVWWLITVVYYLTNEKAIYYSLFLVTLTFISLIVSLIMVSSCNLIIIYLTMEIQSLCFYILAAWNDKFELKGAEAALKYLFLGGFSSNLFLFGSALIYSSFDSVKFFDIILLLTNSTFFSDPIAYIGFCFLTFGILFKLAIVPFHFWIADVYEGSHWLVVSFFSVMPKLPYIYLLIQFWYILFNPFHYILFLKELWIFIAIISVFYGCIFMLYTSNLGRIAAYSSIINMSFVLFSMACGSNIVYILFYLFAYLIQLFLFFIVIVYCRVNYVHDLQDLFHKNPYLAFALTIALFSLMGIPPFAGFFAKFFLIKSFVANHEILLSFIFVLLSVLSAVPYLRLIRMIYSFVGRKTLKDITFNNKYTYSNMLFLNILLLINIFFFIFVPKILNAIINLTLV